MFKMLAVLIVLTTGWAGDAFSQSPYVNSAVVDSEFVNITAADMDALRNLKILFASRSWGLNMVNGLTSVAAKNSI